MGLKNSLIDFMFICFLFNSSNFFFVVVVFINIIIYLKGEILYNSFVAEEKNVKYTDSYDVTDLRTCYVQ